MNMEQPWLPEDPAPDFDPLEHAGVAPGPDTPIVVTPRGGAREVGRSCYQVDTEQGTYLVDAGLNQGDGGQFPDLRGLDPGQIDSVFLTHAHIDHCGALPVLENRGLLSDDAQIIATRPTAQIAQTLLEDSLKIHKRECQQSGHSQRFTQDDVTRVYERFRPIDYGEFSAGKDFDGPSKKETMQLRYGNAGHLLGSAWVSLQVGGYRVVFSGDVGGRTKYLAECHSPPTADLLVCESTYGSTEAHTSASDARTELFRTIERALKDRKPVLIPTFSVGRAQAILLMLNDRLHTLPSRLREQLEIVVDGMAQEATQLYHTHIRNDTYFDSSIPNRVANAGDTQPFLPKGTKLPNGDWDRERILDQANPAEGENIPVVISPSGMLTGGNSPRYLAEFAARYDEAQVVFSGYQAVGTPGRALQNAVTAGEEFASVTMNVSPVGTDWPSSDRVVWTQDDSGNQATRVRVPAEWVATINGLSAHQAQMGLLRFARDVNPDQISLVHGPSHAQERLANHFVDNVSGVEGVSRARMLTPIPVNREVETDQRTSSLTPEETHHGSLKEQVKDLRELVRALSEEVAEARLEQGLSESDVRNVVRNEMEDA